MDDDFKDFVENYEIKILSDRSKRVKNNTTRFFSDPVRADIIFNDEKNFEIEKIYTVEIPEGKLKTLIEIEKRFFKWQKHHRSEVDMFEMLMNKEREEANYRLTNEAVKKAYEQYSLMLNLHGFKKD